MNDAFAWLNRIIDGLLQFIPRISVIKSTEGGVAFVRGRPRPIAPGRLFMWWPFWTEMWLIPVNRQTIDLRGQHFVTKDGKPITISGIVVYDIGDAMQTIITADNHDDAIRDIALGVLLTTIRGMTLEDMIAELGGLDALFRKAVAQGVRGWGVRIRNCYLSDFAPCTVLRLVGGIPQADRRFEPLDEAGKT